MSYPAGCAHPRDDRCCALSHSWPACDAAIAGDHLVERFVAEVRRAPELADLVALVPVGRPLSPWDLISIGPAVWGRLVAAEEQARVLDALGQAYVRARDGDREHRR